MPKPRTTKTLGPLHFEDLDPHRFEDLVRELAYDFKDWQSIEATGRSGSDEGWDIRAFEKAPSAEVEPDDEEAETPPHPMEGNAWMIQVKREKALGPSDVKRIIADVDGQNPPYGYILAAPTNFSKKSYDVFWAELRAKGVREFYVWSRAELEDMLHMPKNDRILFTFFGISLATRRRSRTTEVKAAIAVKNKLYRAVGEGSDLYKDVLIRDLADTHYPYRNRYPDFDKHRRWRQLTASRHHPLGLWLHEHRYYAYVDRKKKEFDFTTAFDLCDYDNNPHRSDKERENLQARQQPVLDAWEFLPKACQAVIAVDALLPYSRIAAVDEKGDVLYECPHIFVDFGTHGPFEEWWETVKIGDETIDLSDEFKRVQKFPKAFKLQPVREAKTEIPLDEQTANNFVEFKDVGVLFAADERYKNLMQGDVVSIKDAKPKFGQEPLLQITYVGRSTVGEYLSETWDRWKHRPSIQAQVGRDVADDESITYLEYKRYHKRPKEEDSAPPIIVAPAE
jgi:hypothetical protein